MTLIKISCLRGLLIDLQQNDPKKTKFVYFISIFGILNVDKISFSISYW